MVIRLKIPNIRARLIESGYWHRFYAQTNVCAVVSFTQALVSPYHETSVKLFVKYIEMVSSTLYWFLIYHLLKHIVMIIRSPHLHYTSKFNWYLQYIIIIGVFCHFFFSRYVLYTMYITWWKFQVQVHILLDISVSAWTIRLCT